MYLLPWSMNVATWINTKDTTNIFPGSNFATLWSECKQNDLNFLLLHRKYVIIAVIIKKYRFFLTVSFEDLLPPLLLPIMKQMIRKNHP